ncbi:MAG: glycosyltransferase [Anaerolineaceae bacterium]|nr:glycosyltransferase [Anaerolineaceae bacterium]
MSSQRPPRVLAIIPAIIPSTIMLIIRPFQRLHARGVIETHILPEVLVGKRILDWADLVIFPRCISPSLLKWANYLDSQGVPWMYDLDDNFFDVPADTAFGKYVRRPEPQQTLRRLIRGARQVRVYARPLYEQVREYNPHVVQVSPPLDWAHILPRRSSPGDTVKIVYATSRTRDDELGKIFLPALRKIFTDFPRVELYFLGSNPLSDLVDERIHFERFTRNYEEYLERFSSAGYDIGLAPLLDDLFHRSKTNVKFREYGASRIAGVYSNVSVYSDWVTHGHNGLLVENTTQDWYQAIASLIEDTALRQQIQQQAFADVHEHFSEEQFDETWLQMIHQVLEMPREEQSPGPSPSTPPAAGDWGSLSRLARVRQKIADHDLTPADVSYFVRHYASSVWHFLHFEYALRQGRKKGGA